jgi:hypothetical protein
MEEDYIVAAFLHPNYKQLCVATHSQMANCYAACRISVLPNTSSLSAASQEEDEQTNKNGKRLTVTLMNKTKKRKLSSTDEVDRYNELLIKDGDQFQNPLDFWKQRSKQLLFPNLFRFALRYFAKPWSSAAIERKLSVAGQLITQRRSSLDPSTVNNIIFLRLIEKNSFATQWSGVLVNTILACEKWRHFIVE